MAEEASPSTTSSPPPAHGDAHPRHQRDDDLQRDRQRRRLARHFLPRALAGLPVALLPLSILAAAAEAHRPNIQAIGDAGSTAGFADPYVPLKRVYDPKANVTRAAMASFLARTAGLGANAPVVNAVTAQTATLATNATRVTRADPAATVGGDVPNQLTRAATQTTTATVTFTATDQPVVAVTIVAPGPGVALVDGLFNAVSLPGVTKALICVPTPCPRSDATRFLTSPVQGANLVLT